MSLILDALKRAERERQAESGPVLADVTATGAPAARRRWIRLVALLIALAAVATAVAWGLRHGNRARPAPAAVARTVPASAAAPQPAPAPPPATVAPTPAVPAPPVPIPGTESVGSLDEIAEEPAPEPAPTPEPQPPAKAATPMPQPAPPSQPPPLAGTQPALQPAPAETAPAGETPPAPAAPSAEKPVPPALTQPAPLRRLREMPPEYRADFPALSIDVHVYDRAPSQRFVIVNGRHYREGEQLVEGPRIVEIVRDGIVVDYRGEKVLYPISR